MSWWTRDRQAYALNYLVSYGGLSPIGAAGLVSRWTNVESSQGPASVNPYSGAFGIAQWRGARLPPILGNTSFDAQLAYTVRELGSSESRAGQILRSASNADQAAVGASTYERAEGYNVSTGRDNYTTRTANGVMAVLASAGVGGSSGDNSVPVPGGNTDFSLPEGSTTVGVVAIGLAAVLLALVLFSD